jgi:hypothetical protein
MQIYVMSLRILLYIQNIGFLIVWRLRSRNPFTQPRINVHVFTLSFADTLSLSIFRIIQLLLRYPLPMDQISIKTPKPKCRHFLKMTSKGTWRQVFICLRPPPHLGFVWVGKVLFKAWNLVKYRVYNSCICSPHNPVPSPPLSLCMNTYPCTNSHKEGGGGGEPVRRLEGC